MRHLFFSMILFALAASGCHDAEPTGPATGGVDGSKATDGDGNDSSGGR